MVLESLKLLSMKNWPKDFRQISVLHCRQPVDDSDLCVEKEHAFTLQHSIISLFESGSQLCWNQIQKRERACEKSQTQRPPQEKSIQTALFSGTFQFA